MQAQGKPAGELFVERSFTRIGDVMPSLKFISKPLLYLKGWNFNPINAMKRMDKRTQTTIIEYAEQEDNIIGNHASYKAASERGEITMDNDEGRTMLLMQYTGPEFDHWGDKTNLHTELLSDGNLHVSNQPALQAITTRITGGRVSSFVLAASDQKSVG
jgi:hypothetical protein